MEVQAAGRRANALRRELSVTLSESCAVPREAVWDVLADLRTHAVWGGERQGKNTRIVSIDAPGGRASVGVEFETIGADPMGRFHDRSVVTDATSPATFEFVTEARLETKAGARADWTLVHRYEMTPDDGGCRITYAVRIVRISELVGMLKVLRFPILSLLAMRASASVDRRGLRNLARFAEERAGAAGGPATSEGGVAT